MITVSIITPCYNSEFYLEENIQSVLNQTFSNWEWLITDDQSTDQSFAILNNIQDARIKIFRTPKNSGAGEARNQSLQNATGRYITFLDSDDTWEPQFLEKMIAFMQETQSELAYSSYARCDENLKKILSDFQADTPVTFSNLLKTCRLSLLTSMYDSQRVGKFYFPKNSKREDHIMWLELLKKIPEGKALNLTLANYRMRKGSVSRSKPSIVKDQYWVYKKFMRFSVLKSLYYTLIWAYNGFKKYSH